MQLHDNQLQENHALHPHLYLGADQFEKVDCFKYLGLMLSSDLSWSKHIVSICSKAKRLLGLLYRCFYHHASPQVLLEMYLTLVRPHTEYASTVWDPHLQTSLQHPMTQSPSYLYATIYACTNTLLYSFIPNTVRAGIISPLTLCYVCNS